MSDELMSKDAIQEMLAQNAAMVPLGDDAIKAALAAESAGAAANVNAQKGPLQIKLEEDMLSASIRIEEGATLTEAEIMKALSANQVSFGIDIKRVKELSANPEYKTWIEIAKGIPPTDGIDATLTMCIEINQKPKPVEKPDGTVDFSDLSMVTEVTKGQVLCERTPPTDGTPGRSIQGKLISAIKGIDTPLPSGNNTVLANDGTQLVALVDGRATLAADKIAVSQQFEINGDVDVGTGDIKFKGNVVIGGNVTPGRRVEATGNVEIFGMIEGGTVISGGDITVRGGIVGGGGECFVQAQGTLNCRYMESVTAMAIKDIRAQMILHSTVKCGNLVELYGSKGTIVGGECLCGGNIVARNVGSPAYVRTCLEVGKDPTLTVRSEVIEAEIAEINKSISDMERLEIILKQLKAMGKLTAEKEETLGSIEKTRPVMQSKIKLLETELEEVKKKIWSTTPVEINITGIAYPGTEIVIGSAYAAIDTVMRCKRFSKRDDIIIAK